MALIDDLTNMVEGSAGVIRNLRDERDRLKAANNNAPRVTLEKVAVDRAVARLRQAGIVNPEVCEKLASDIAQNPQMALGLIERLAVAISTTPALTGMGVTKQSSAAHRDPESREALMAKSNESLNRWIGSEVF
jgi:hypothetical protein